jgi:hypothetical protein
MPALINGSPTHALIVHAVVVLLPLSVLAALLTVFVPQSRRAFGLASLGIAFAACLAVPLAFLSGSELRQRVTPTPLISRHVELAHQLLPVAALFGLAFAAFVFVDIGRRAAATDLNRVESFMLTRAPNFTGLAPRTSTLATRATGTVLVIMAIATSVAVFRVGDSGAKAVWHGRLNAVQSQASS